MTRTIGIATAEQDLFDALREYLLQAGIEGINDSTIETAPLPDRQSARDWLDGKRVLVVLDPRLPQSKGGRADEQGKAAESLLDDVRDSGISTPMLVITQLFNSPPDLVAKCEPSRMAIALHADLLRKYRATVLKPFLAMVIRERSDGGEGMAIAAPFRVIEVDFFKDRSVCSIGYADGTLLKWSDTKQLSLIRRTAQIFSDVEIFSRRGWSGQVRLGGETLFQTHVIDAVGAGLFRHIEVAAGGLTGLSFRFVITDPELYPAPFEASVRARDDDQDGLFVLLSAPVVRRLPPPAVIRVSRHRTARIPKPVRVLFIRSQMCEHPDGATQEDYIDLPSVRGSNSSDRISFAFRRLDSIDAEMDAMELLAARLGRDQMVLDPIDLSHIPDGEGTAEAFLLAKLGSQNYDVIHYAGHAWSSGMSGTDRSLLILPGAVLGAASSLPIEEFAAHAGKAETRFVYLSACRGSSARSVQSLVMHGIPHALGFRCNVEDTRATAFAGKFYRSLFDHQSLCTAFREACAAARMGQETDEESPIWITPILLAQTADWAMRT